MTTNDDVHYRPEMMTRYAIVGIGIISALLAMLTNWATSIMQCKKN